MKQLCSLFATLLLAGNLSGEATAVGTFECIGIYYPGAGSAACNVHYRPANATEWRPALDLVYDPRSQEHRGSIVGLEPDADWEVRLTHQGQSTVLHTRTRSDRFPIGKTTPGASRKTQRDPLGGAMIKTGVRGEFGGGRKFIFHNTALQPRGAFTVFSARADPNTVTRNNIFDCPGRLAPGQPADPPGDYDYDFYSGNDPGVAQEPHGVRGRRMAYIASHYLEFYPAPVMTTVQFGKIPVNLGGSTRVITDPVVTMPNPVIDGGVRLPNFNDDFAGRAPDIGAFEVGRPPLRFGRRAVDNIWAPWELHAAEKPES